MAVKSFIVQAPEGEKSHLLYGLVQVENIAGKKQKGEKEKREERVSDIVWLREGSGIFHKFDSWSNSSEPRDN